MAAAGNHAAMALIDCCLKCLRRQLRFWVDNQKLLGLKHVDPQLRFPHNTFVLEFNIIWLHMRSLLLFGSWVLEQRHSSGIGVWLVCSLQLLRYYSPCSYCRTAENDVSQDDQQRQDEWGRMLVRKIKNTINDQLW